MGGLTKLENLNISYSGQQELEEDFGELEKVGRLSCIWLLVFCHGCWNHWVSCHLDTLNLIDSSHLQSLPIAIGGLKNLTFIDLSY